MRDYLTLGPTPCDEACQQVGMDSYNHSKARAECRAYANQLKRMFPNADLGIKSFPHDFGNYLEVVAYYDDSSEESMRIAFEVEGGLPTEWDDEAKKELGL